MDTNWKKNGWKTADKKNVKNKNFGQNLITYLVLLILVDLG